MLPNYEAFAAYLLEEQGYSEKSIFWARIWVDSSQDSFRQLGGENDAIFGRVQTVSNPEVPGRNW